MIKVHLGDADRERYGCDDWLPVDAQSVSIREAITLQGLGFATPNNWRLGLAGEPAKRKDGSTYRQPGKDYLPALLGLVWLALNRNGHQVGIDDLDFNYDDAQFDGDEDEEDSGKDPSTPPTTSEP